MVSQDSIVIPKLAVEAEVRNPGNVKVTVKVETKKL